MGKEIEVHVMPVFSLVQYAENIRAAVKGDKLYIEVDLNIPLTPENLSGSTKNHTIATTGRGPQHPGDAPKDVTFNLNVMRKNVGYSKASDPVLRRKALESAIAAGITVAELQGARGAK